VTGRRLEAWVEVGSAVVLSVAALAIAWSGYQASRWTGEQAKAFSRANAARVESTRWANLANSQTEIDVATFIQWVDSYARHETELADFYRKRFREEFRPAVEAWIATRPLRNPEAP
jgi:predicted Zn-dependent protease